MVGYLVIYALVITSGLGAVYVCGVLLHRALKWRAPVRWRSAIAVLFSLIALAGAAKFCYDLILHRELWRDSSFVIRILNFVGILMINHITLLPAAGALLYLLYGKKQNSGHSGAVDP